MYFTSYTVALLAFLTPTIAWLPGKNKDIVARDGKNLFRETTSQLSRRQNRRTLPASGKIRGVNLGSLFIVEPWMASTEWSSMGCGAYKSEFDCVSGIGQTKANQVFQTHWGSWIKQADFTEMQNYGLNTVRIPVGYWMDESIVSSSEYFPQGGLSHLAQICDWAADAGLYIIIDMHGAPEAQAVSNPFTGQDNPKPGFYDTTQYDRGTTFLTWLTNQIHTNNDFRNVGMIEVVNEPISSAPDSLRSYFYLQAYNAIRTVETSLGVTSDKYLHVQFMDTLWGSGDPKQFLIDLAYTAFDDHRYIKYDTSVAVTQDAYISNACTHVSASSSETPTIVGEWSLSPPDDVESTPAWDITSNLAFYKNFFAAQVIGFEAHTEGWIFWSWKTQLSEDGQVDYRWSYKDAVTAGVIPRDLDSIATSGACG